ncbi:hypothetical protein BJY16_005234 [Actinoplanes octamycinicus]|uniref:Uncharacterized protein n=1 Tax=Actinoplanes octamycinicus TaxID=135948 RepID=A0A7W7H0K5_9ACTN|nr:hypothetical protein [Actinoplanes octamycinicus]MBB4741775.1 hypothetical protein [Actinoplanes octamycinicus]GIE57332.1 hypothetical protein Aoc01nite_27340 [Actinoplanes octamycinicus]
MFLHDGRPLGQEVRWAAFPWPESRAGNEKNILAALRAVLAPNPKDWSDAGTMVRCAVGNDHRGSLYPAALAMVDILLFIAREYPGEPRCVALSVVADWWGGYEPEHGFESFAEAGGATVAVIPAIVQKMTDAIPLLQTIAGVGSDPTAAALARDLLTVIPLGWGNAMDGGVVQHWGGQVAEDGSVRFPGDRA